jgi:dTDP-4-amino-4,6-dideoxygalactose transaminase
MTIRIPLSAPDITSAEIDAVTAVLRTDRLSLGPELEAFEQVVAAYHSMPDAVAVSSGSAGLHLALLALGIGEGCEVIVPSFAFIAVANAVLQVHATPVFVDIDPVTLNLDPALAEQAITSRTRAILVVHTFGVPAEMGPLQQIARRHNLALLEDACEAIGAEYDSRKAGSFGDLAVLGFYPNKQITTGEGGCILVRNPDLADRLRSLRNQGRASRRRGVTQESEYDPASSWFEHAEIGYNYRLSELAAALGRAQLGRIDEILAMRRAAAEHYQSLLETISALELPLLARPRLSISWFVYVVRLRANRPGSPGESGFRDRVQAALEKEGIATGRYFAPIHQQPAWCDHPSSVAANLPVTEMIAPFTLALPFFNRITMGQQEKVAEALSLTMRECKR